MGDVLNHTIKAMLETDLYHANATGARAQPSESCNCCFQSFMPGVVLWNGLCISIFAVKRLLQI